MSARAELDERILAIVRDFHRTEWVTADLVHRMLRRHMEASLMLVARRLSKLAADGQLEREPGDGSWTYRALETGN
jgi:hypothetical protein